MRAEWVCADWDELTAELGLPEGSLAATMADYNESAAHGEDPEFGKRPEWLVPLDEPPFGAIDLRVAATIYAGFPLGGVVTTPDGQVVRTDGSAVDGLYAVGRVASSLALARYCSGISLGEGTFFGRRAAAGGDPGRSWVTPSCRPRTTAHSKLRPQSRSSSRKFSGLSGAAAPG